MLRLTLKWTSIKHKRPRLKKHHRVRQKYSLRVEFSTLPLVFGNVVKEMQSFVSDILVFDYITRITEGRARGGEGSYSTVFRVKFIVKWSSANVSDVDSKHENVIKL